MYFTHFPVIPYDSVGDFNFKVVTNLLKRVAVRTKIKTNTLFFDTYDVKEGERPEDIADKLYGDPELHWVVLLVNDITDRYHQWPMSGPQFRQYLNDKYTNPDGTHHFEIVQKSGDTTVKIDVGTVATDYGSSVETFNPSSDVDGEYITTTTAHTFSVGDAVFYSSASGTRIPDLTENEKYFIISVAEGIVLDGSDDDFQRIVFDGTDGSSTDAGSKIRLDGTGDGTILNEASATNTRHIGDAVVLEDGKLLVGEDTTTLFKISGTKGGGPIALTTGSDELHSFTKDSDVAIPITNREFEERRQDTIRSIRLLDPEYVGTVVNEFKGLLRLSVL